MRQLASMGSVIPINAFPICMTSILCVKLGNSFGVSWAAQPNADELLNKITKERWIYYFNEVLPNDERVLYKIQFNSRAERWADLITSRAIFQEIRSSIENSKVKKLLDYSLNRQVVKIVKVVEEIYTDFKS
ncbi:MAG: hypothetical protein ACKO96_22310, partial [Flammeovirgaceae bacterium]